MSFIKINDDKIPRLKCTICNCELFCHTYFYAPDNTIKYKYSHICNWNPTMEELDALKKEKKNGSS